MTSADSTVRFLRLERRSVRHIVTPEGIVLAVDLAERGERATAFLLDLFFWLCGSVAVVLSLLLLVRYGLNGTIALSVFLFVTFVIRNFYFIYFELAWQGSTPGKRIVGIRVIDRHGGPLLPASVVARNLVREIETFVPLGVLISVSASGGAAIPWERVALGAWLICFLALIFFNRDRMRAGDLIAGTIVVAMPRQRLLQDLVERRASFVFTESQLKAYGAFELQVLEDILRRPDAPTAQMLTDVRAKIARKIAWREPVTDRDTPRFLRDFYAAQRAYLERQQLLGRKRADKYDVAEISKPGAPGRH
jgi:uncharacterized RDD family membrane protein YckC